MTPRTALVGRDAELALVVERLATRRLVTLVGPGGIGKTTLAHTAASRLAPSYPEGSRLVDLTLIDEPDAVPESIASQLGYSSFTAVLDAPSDHPVLLVVDNCEHVIDAVADAVSALLSVCDMPTVLATSRMALGLPGEAVVPLGALGLPTGEQVDAPATRLFLERAHDAGSALEATRAVAELCRRLDGIPLAIELAAARSRSMTPDEMLARLGEGLDVLHRPRSRRSPRHRSLSAAIAWSFRLLDPAQQGVFTDLAVFSGPFTAAAAHAVAGPPSSSPAATQDHLNELVDASMLVAESFGATTRYRMLETVRAWAREQLDAQGRRHEVLTRFVDHVVSVVSDIVARGASTWSADALADLHESYSSIASAVRWCLHHDPAPDRALLFVAALWGLVHQEHTEEIGELAERVIERWPGADHPMAADAVATAATCRYMLGDHDGAVSLAVAHLSPAEGSPFAPATLRRAIAQSRRAEGDTDGAIRWFAEAASAARGRALTSMATECDAARAQVLADLGHVDDALGLVDDACSEARSAGSAVGVVWATAIRGSILLRRSPSDAESTLVHALEQARELGYDAGVSVCLRSLAIAALLRGDVRAAAVRADELFDDLLARGSTYELRMVLDVVAPVLDAAGSRARAADLSATALSLPVVSITASVGHELIPLDPTGGRVLAVRDAIVTARDALRELVDADEGDDQPPQPDDPASAPAEARSGSFRSLGDTWELGLDGNVVTMRSSKGLADLARLLQAPHRELHCLDLVGASAVQADTGEMIDESARRAYVERVRDLQGEIDEAEAANDLARADRARFELDAIVDQLAAALGAGGTRRTTGSTTERARSAVTQRIRSTIRRIEELHPELGRHLHAAIRTGTWCSYVPEHPVDWRFGPDR